MFPWTHWRTFKVFDEYVILQLYTKCPCKSEVVNATQMFNGRTFTALCRAAPSNQNGLNVIASLSLLAFIFFADLPCEKASTAAMYGSVSHNWLTCQFIVNMTTIASFELTVFAVADVRIGRPQTQNSCFPTFLTFIFSTLSGFAITSACAQGQSKRLRVIIMKHNQGKSIIAHVRCSIFDGCILSELFSVIESL